MNAALDTDKRVINVRFDGVDDIMSYTTKFRQDDCPELLKQEALRFGEVFHERNDWNGRQTASDIEAALLEPTPETAENMKTGDALFDSDDWATEKPRRKLKRRLEDGDEIDIDRWREREPDMWEESKKVKGLRYGVRIGVNVSASAGVDKKGFKWRASTVMAMLRIVEELNIPCEVMGYEYADGIGRVRTDGGYNNYAIHLEFPVKRSEHLLDVDLLSYVLGDRSFFRVGILGAEVMAMKEAFGVNIDIEGSLGSPRSKSDPGLNEFILQHGCTNETVAKKELKRFKEWLIQIRKNAQYMVDAHGNLMEESGSFQ
jgi:hypothetical protein